MKKILLSVRPKYCELIFNGKKTIEVRRTRPKLEPPFEVLVYCTMPKERWSVGHQIFFNDTLYTLPTGELKLGDALELIADWLGKYDANNFLNGKVIGSFICDRIFELKINGDDYGNYWHEWDDEGDIQDMCLSYEELETYLGKSVGHGWHITEPKLFDEPRALSEFRTPFDCEAGKKIGCWLNYCKNHNFDCVRRVNAQITRSPQSWCYVEER